MIEPAEMEMATVAEILAGDVVFGRRDGVRQRNHEFGRRRACSPFSRAFGKKCGVNCKESGEPAAKQGASW